MSDCFEITYEEMLSFLCYMENEIEDLKNKCHEIERQYKETERFNNEKRSFSTNYHITKDMRGSLLIGYKTKQQKTYLTYKKLTTKYKLPFEIDISKKLVGINSSYDNISEELQHLLGGETCITMK